MIGLWILAFCIAVFFLFFSGKKEEKEDPQSEANRTEAENGAETEITESLISQNAADDIKSCLKQNI